MRNNFTKMHGLGNDFIVFKGPQNLTLQQINSYCNRHMGIGADGLIVVNPINPRQVEMQYWNADGTPAEMCGNGLRCTVRFAVENQLVNPGEFVVKTAVGLLKVVWDGKDPTKIEVQVGKETFNKNPISLYGETFYSVNVGNPHAVTFVDDVGSAPVQSLGPQIEADDHFPDKTNVEFVQVISPSKIKMRVWERGVGETLACGTGMVASAVAACEVKSETLPIEVEAPGGTAQIYLDSEGYFRIIGPAEVVFKGSME